MAIVTGPMSYVEQDWNLRDNEEWRLNPLPIYKTPFLDEIADFDGATQFDEVIKWYEATAKKRCDQLAEALDESETEIDVDDGTQFYKYSMIQVDDEIMQVTAISTNTLTVTRGAAETTPATHLDNATVYIFPQTLPEYVTAYMEANAATDTAPISLSNYGQCFALDINYDELYGSVLANNRQKGIQTAEQMLQTQIRDMKARMEMQAILGRPYLSTSKTVPSMMGGLKYYIEQAGQNVASDTTNLTRASLNQAMKAIDRAGGTADWVLMNSSDWEVISEGWGEQRVVDKITTEIGHTVDVIKTAYGRIKLRYNHELPRKTMYFGNSQDIKIANCNGLRFGRYVNNADANTTVNHVQYRGWYTMKVTNVARSFAKLTWSGDVDSDGV